MIDYPSFYDWANQKKNRFVEVKLENDINGLKERAWVYDSDLGIGDFVESVDEIDLVSKARQRLEENIKKLEALK